MKIENCKLKITALLIFVVIGLIISIVAVRAWTNPTANPPGGGGALYYSGGNVGIGTTGPTKTFQIGNPSNSASIYNDYIDTINNMVFESRDNNDGGAFLFRSNKDAGTSDLVKIQRNGNVGIGTTAPGYKLDVKGNIVNSNPSQGYLGLTGDLPGYANNVYPTLKTNASYIYFSAGGAYSAYMSSAGTWTAVSDRNKKENFIEVNPQEILAKIDQMPMYQWNFKDENPSIKHIAPIGQDFYAAFGLNGDNDKMISHIDPSGVALVGVKALSNKLSVLEKGLMVDKTTGNLGIGTTNPAYKLDVDGTIRAQGVILTSPNGTCYRVTVSDAGALNTASITCP